MFSDPEFYNSLRVSITFAFYSVVLTVLLALGLSLLGNIRIRGITVFRTFFSSTIAVSGATASLIFLLLFNLSIGVFNYMLDLLSIAACALADQHELGAVLGVDGYDLAGARAQYNHHPGGHAGHSRRAVRGGAHRRRRFLEPVPPRDAAAPLAHACSS